MSNTKDLQIAQNTDIISSLVLQGDVGKMSSTQKVQYYNNFCESLGLNPLTQPFQIIKFQGKEILYATKSATEQLRKVHGVSVIELEKTLQGDIYIVTAKVQDKNGRYDAATGAVNIKGLSGDALCNAYMKAETKAKRRATLSICGLGMLDESETDSIGKYEKIDIKTGEVIEQSKSVEEDIDDSNMMGDIIDKKKNFMQSIRNSKSLDELKESHRHAVFYAREIKDKSFEKDINAIKDFMKMSLDNDLSGDQRSNIDGEVK